MRRPAPAYAAEPRPIADLNMTPLIDVLLVLIVMFILLVPTITHKVTIDLPPPGPTAMTDVPHRLTISREGVVALDGAVLTDAALVARLPAVVGDGALTLAADPQARYERVDQLLALVKRAGVTKLGFEGLAEMGRR